MGVKDSFLGRLLSNTSTFSQEQVAETVTLLLENGLKQGATDIHIEPHGELVWVRYRIQGSLHGLHKLPALSLEPLLAQLKKQAGLVLSELAAMPQGTHFTTLIGGKEHNIRLDTMPVVGGERAVLHFGQTTLAASSLQDLGFWGSNLNLVHKTLAQVHGFIIVTGPRQSNRPATLYGLLNLLRTASVSIATIEETIEHRMAGMNQTKISGHTSAAYADAFHAALRQDMNAIMIANLPSKEVAADAVHAATSGHLIAAGLHSDTAVRAILHLKHMGVESFMLAAALRLAIAERTVRRLCPDCRERIVPAAGQAERLEKIFGMTTPATRKRVHNLEQAAEQAGIGAGLPLSSTTSRLTHVWQASENGCEACHHSGFQGNVTLVEVLPGGEYLYTALTDSATTTELQAAALKEGFIPIALDGIIKALRGETTTTEVMHAVGQA